MYTEMYNASYNQGLMPDATDLFNTASGYRSDTVPILMMDMEMHKFKDSTVFNSGYYFLFDTVNHFVLDNPSRTISPYSQGAVFKGANFKDQVPFADPIFKIDPALIFIDSYNAPDYTGGNLLKIDFGDDNGFQLFNPASTQYYQGQYPDSGNFTITYQLTDPDGAVLKQSRSSVFVSSPRNAVDFGIKPSGINIPGLQVSVIGSNCTTMPKKPLIFLTGYDFMNDLTAPFWFSKYIEESQLNDVSDFGYDIYIVQYDNANDALQTNATRVVQLIEHLKCNEYANTDEQFVVVGFSMGGLIGRWALTYMENPDNYDPDKCRAEVLHNTRLFISADSPQQGVNLPLSIQHAYKNANIVFPAGFASSQINDLFKTNALNSVAAKQMLLLHVDTKTGYDYDRHPFGIQFFDQLQSMGNYPRFCKKVAFSHGMFTGKRQDNLKTGDPKPLQATFLDAGLRTRASILWLKFTLVDQSIQLNSNPMGFGKLIDVTSEVWKIKLRFKIFGVSFKQKKVDWLLDRSGNNLHAICTSQGGYYATEDANLKTSNLYANWAVGAFNMNINANGNPILDFSGSVLGVDFLAGVSPETDGFDFNFVPSFSAVDANFTWMPHLANGNLTALSTAQIMNRTPFDVIVGGAPTNSISPYDIEYNTSSGPITWDVDQNNHHEHILRNENVITPQNDEIGWLLREIGDEELWLENYNLQHTASFLGVRGIDAGWQLFPHYNYPTQVQTNFMAGVYSKEQPMVITPTGAATMYYNTALGGNFQNLGVVNNGVLANQNISAFPCIVNQGYANKTEQPLSVDVDKISSEDGIVVYPVPSNNQLNISSTSNIKAVELYQINGKLVLQNKGLFTREHAVNLSQLPAGLYLLKTKTKQSSYTKTIQKL